MKRAAFMPLLHRLPTERFPEKWTKWTPAFRRKCDQLKQLERISDSTQSKGALEGDCMGMENASAGRAVNGSAEIAPSHHVRQRSSALFPDWFSLWLRAATENERWEHVRCSL